MAADSSVDDRVERERAFHDERFALAADDGRERFYDHVDDATAALREATDRFAPGQRVLELGCGIQSLGWELAARGVEVVAVDISGVAVERCAFEADAAGLDHIEFRTMNAEALDLADDRFHGVIGTGILHHLDLDRAYAEVARVLRADGTAVFYEPLGHNPLINAYRRRTPEIRTADEHPLRRADLRRAELYFGRVETSMHQCLGLGASVLPESIATAVRPALAGLDRAVLRLPGLRWMAWITVIELSRPR